MYSPTSSVLIKLYNGIISFNHKLLSTLQSPSRLDDQCQESHKYGHWDLLVRSCWSALQRLWVLLKINLFLVEGHISSRLLLSSLHSLLDTLRYLIACLDLAKWSLLEKPWNKENSFILYPVTHHPAKEDYSDKENLERKRNWKPAANKFLHALSHHLPRRERSDKSQKWYLSNSNGFEYLLNWAFFQAKIIYFVSFCRWLLARLVHLVLRCLLDPKSGVSLSRFKPIMIRGGSDPKHTRGYGANTAMKFEFFFIFRSLSCSMRLCAVQEQSQPEILLHWARAHECTEAWAQRAVARPSWQVSKRREVDQRSLALLLMLMRRVRGSISPETSWSTWVHWGAIQENCY